MGRPYGKRRLERITRLREQLAFLTGRIEAHASRNEGRDRAFVSALAWALEEIERFDMVERVMASDTFTDESRCEAIRSVCESRHKPSAADLARTPGIERERLRRNAKTAARRANFTPSLCKWCGERCDCAEHKSGYDACEGCSICHEQHAAEEVIA